MYNLRCLTDLIDLKNPHIWYLKYSLTLVVLSRHCPSQTQVTQFRASEGQHFHSTQWTILSYFNLFHINCLFSGFPFVVPSELFLSIYFCLMKPSLRIIITIIITSIIVSFHNDGLGNTVSHSQHHQLPAVQRDGAQHTTEGHRREGRQTETGRPLGWLVAGRGCCLLGGGDPGCWQGWVGLAVAGDKQGKTHLNGPYLYNNLNTFSLQ